MHNSMEDIMKNKIFKLIGVVANIELLSVSTKLNLVIGLRKIAKVIS